MDGDGRSLMSKFQESTDSKPQRSTKDLQPHETLKADAPQFHTVSTLVLRTLLMNSKKAASTFGALCTHQKSV